MYDMGRGVLQDKAKAVRLYEEAVEQGLAVAQCYLGFMAKLGNKSAQKDLERLK